MLDVYEYTNKGGRDYNEDSVGSVIGENNSGIFVVADGLGGHSKGELASACVVETLCGQWKGFGENPDETLRELITAANGRVLELQKENNAIIKSTVAVLALDNGIPVWGNSGDSRVYFIRDNEMAAYTEDHSVAFKKFKGGEITRDMLGTDEDQSRLLRTLGSKDRFMPDIRFDPGLSVIPGDAFFLCSDGAWEFIKDEEIVIDYLRSENARHWAELMMVRIIDRVKGDNDNISLMTVCVT